MARCLALLPLIVACCLAAGCGLVGSSFELTVDGGVLEASLLDAGSATPADTGAADVIPAADATMGADVISADTAGDTTVVADTEPAADTFEPDSMVDTGVPDACVGTCGEAATPELTVGGTLIGLAPGATVVLGNNGGGNLTLTANGPFTFLVPVAMGASYAVTVLTEPSSPAQVCAVGNGSGTIAGANVSNVTVTCTTASFTVGGTLTGLAAGSNVVLQDNAGNNLTVGANGPFTFSTPVPSGGSYAVTVLTQPAMPVQICKVSGGGSGTVAAANVTSVQVSCAAGTFTIGGTLAGLAAGNTIVLQDNGGDDLTLTASGTFSFATQLATGQAYAVTILTQPSSPPQSCTVSSGSGTVAGGNVQGVNVNCSSNTFTVGGTLAGLSEGDTLLLKDNGTDVLFLSANGPFSFPTSLLTGATYTVTLVDPAVPVDETCTLTMATGVVGTADVTNVAVACVPLSFRVGGTLAGLAAGDTVVLQDNGGDNLMLTANGAFTFPTIVQSGSPYAVSVLTNPTAPVAQTCTLAAGTGSGNVGNSPVSSVQITCVNSINLTGLAFQYPSGGRNVYLFQTPSCTVLSTNTSFCQSHGLTWWAPVSQADAQAITVNAYNYNQWYNWINVYGLVTTSAGTLNGYTVNTNEAGCVSYNTSSTDWAAVRQWACSFCYPPNNMSVSTYNGQSCCWDGTNDEFDYFACQD